MSSDRIDLKGLSRGEKEELYKLLKQKETTVKEAVLETFQPHPGQKVFLESPAKIRALFCGNGFGKTVAMTIELIRTHTRKHPTRDTHSVHQSWLLIPDLAKAEDYWTEIKKWCPPSSLPKPNKLGSANIRRLEWPNGTYTTIYSHEQDSSKLEGTNIDALFCDEPPPRDLWVAAFRGLRNNPDYFVVLAGTPVSAAWMYEQIYLPGVLKQDPNIEIFRGTTYDNPYLSKDFIEEFAKQLTDDEKKVRLAGEFHALQGRVFKEFDTRKHVIETQSWPTDWPVYMAIDPHTRKKSTAVWMGVTSDDDFVVINEACAEDIQKLGDTIKSIEAHNNYRVVARKIDNSGSARGWKAETAIELLRDQGIRVSPMRNAEKAVMNGIVKLQKLLKIQTMPDGTKKPQLFVMAHCSGVIRDFTLYGWDAQRNEEEKGMREAPKKINDDYIDPLRYIIMCHPRYNVSLQVIETNQGAYQPGDSLKSLKSDDLKPF